MTRDQALQSVIDSHIVEKLASSLWSWLSDKKQDFQQYIYQLLCEMDEDKLIGLVERGEIGYYLYFISKAQATGVNSDFNRLYKKVGDINIDEIKESI